MDESHTKSAQPSHAPMRWGLLALILLTLSVAHFVTSPHHPWAHDFLFKVTYVPIVLAALWFGWRAGLLTALITGAIYIFHILLQLAGHHDHSQTGLVLELVLYCVIGVVVGLLSDRQRAAQRRLEDAYDQLQQSMDALREKTEALLTAEESLRRVDRLKAAGEIATGLAHEVRNPLGGITGAADILTNPDTDSNARAEFAAVLKKEAKRLDRVITQFLDFARPGNAVAGSANLRQEIEFVEKLTAGPRGKKATAFAIADVPKDIRVDVSSDALRQIILNLTLNALAAVPDQSGTISWSAERQKDRVAVRISDNGHGVDASVRNRLFEPFVTTRGGTGLGLAIVGRLVADAGGAVSLEKSDATGTRFQITLPITGAQNLTLNGQEE